MRPFLIGRFFFAKNIFSQFFFATIRMFFCKINFFANFVKLSSYHVNRPICDNRYCTGYLIFLHIVHTFKYNLSIVYMIHV